MLDVFIFDLDDILFILVYNTEKLALNLYEVLAYLIFVEEVHLLL
jgi:hypothetical protein